MEDNSLNILNLQKGDKFSVKLKTTYKCQENCKLSILCMMCIAKTSMYLRKHSHFEYRILALKVKYSTGFKITNIL